MCQNCGGETGTDEKVRVPTLLEPVGEADRKQVYQLLHQACLGGGGGGGGGGGLQCAFADWLLSEVQVQWLLAGVRVLQVPVKEGSLSCRVSKEGAQAEELPVLGHQESHRTLGLRAGSPMKIQCLEVGG